MFLNTGCPETGDPDLSSSPAGLFCADCPPTLSPTTAPTSAPTLQPSSSPTSYPTMPTPNPSEAPTEIPTEAPTKNESPELIGTLIDKTAKVDEPFQYAVPVDEVFSDPDGDILSYEANEVGEADLPGWLRFEPDTQVFLGTPNEKDEGSYHIRIIAVDTDTFVLDVIEDVEKATNTDDGSSWKNWLFSFITLTIPLGVAAWKLCKKRQKKKMKALLIGNISKLNGKITTANVYDICSTIEDFEKIRKWPCVLGCCCDWICCKEFAIDKEALVAMIHEIKQGTENQRYEALEMMEGADKATHTLTMTEENVKNSITQSKMDKEEKTSLQPQSSSDGSDQ